MSCSWSSNIARFIRPLSHGEPQCPRRYPHNIIWKRAVVQAVERDLTYGIQGRRFMRLDDLGLGGMVMYDIDESLEWDAVFGKVGMSVEELLDAIRVQMIYVPLYACTSFVVRTSSLVWQRRGTDQGGK
ncbi:hypothetical protein CPB85DRAFT_1277290 [Mucidula mucida]|nr:hypothetical protein CPB85DRAFT_1277290 [Mucidula mucida]